MAPLSGDLYQIGREEIFINTGLDCSEKAIFEAFGHGRIDEVLNGLRDKACPIDDATRAFLRSWAYAKTTPPCQNASKAFLEYGLSVGIDPQASMGSFEGVTTVVKTSC
jgi:hypothetical protein